MRRPRYVTDGFARRWPWFGGEDKGVGGIEGTGVVSDCVGTVEGYEGLLVLDLVFM